jgi:hypothetical protein
MRSITPTAFSFLRRNRTQPARTLLHSLAMGALILLLLLSGAGVTFAVWTSQATAGATAGGAQLQVSTDFANADAVFADHVLSSTGSFTISNATDTTSTTPASYTATLGYTGDAALAGALSLTVWPYSASAPCTASATPSGVVATGTWASVTGVITGTLAAPGTVTYCLRMTGGERGDLATPDGELLINPSVSVSLAVGNWVATDSANAVQKTAFIFPKSTPTASTWFQITNIGTGKCVDVHSATTAAGTGVIDYTCKTGNTADDYNQHWKFTATDTGYVTLTPRHATTLLMDVVGDSPNVLAAIDIQAAVNPAQPSQQWQFQQQGANVFQIVNRLSGLCLQPNNIPRYPTDVEYAQAVCDGSSSQRFSLTQKTVDVPTMTGVTCTPSGSGVTYSWTGNAVDTYDFQVRQGANPFTTVKSALSGSNSVTILPIDMAAQVSDGQYNVRSFWNNNVLASTNLWKATTAGVTTLHCSPNSDIVVTAVATPTSIDQFVGGAAEWLVTAVNNGPLPSGAGTFVVTIPASTGYTVAPSAGTCTGTGTARTCSFTNLPVGSSLAVKVTRTIPTTQAAGDLVVTGVANLTGGNIDPVGGNNNASATLTIIDRAAPTVPGTPASSATSLVQTTLTWARSTDNVAVAHYDVYRNGILVTSVASNGAATQSFTDTGLSSWTTYVYTVTARDANGNQSASSGSRSVVTSLPAGSFEISNSSRCVRYNSGVVLANCNGNSDRTWTFAQSSNGFVEISNTGTPSRSLAAAATGTVLTTSTATPATTAQEWKMTPSGVGYTFESRSRPGMCIQYATSSTVQLAACSAAASQVWAVNP